MAKKTLIISKKQLDEICGGNSSYFDSSTPDMSGFNYANEISSDGSVDFGYADATTTDDISHDMTNNWRGNAKLHGMGPITVREWREIYLNEEQEHGNARLKNVQFGAQNGEEGKSYGATKTALSRLGAAQKTMKTGATQEIKEKAAKTAATMQKNWSGIGAAANQYKAAKGGDKTVRQNLPSGKKRKPKSTNNGLPGVFI